MLAVSNSHHTPHCATNTAQTAHGLAPPGVTIQNIVTPTSIAGCYALTTPNGIIENYMPRKLPDLPVFGGQPEDWPIFYCVFTETTQAYKCTDLRTTNAC